MLKEDRVNANLKNLNSKALNNKFPWLTETRISEKKEGKASVSAPAPKIASGASRHSGRPACLDTKSFLCQKEREAFLELTYNLPSTKDSE